MILASCNKCDRSPVQEDFAVLEEGQKLVCRCGNDRWAIRAGPMEIDDSTITGGYECE